MMHLPSFGLTPRVVGTVMKEATRRAINVILQQRATFTYTHKTGYSGEMDDFVTTADQAAQNIYTDTLRLCFPGYGIIAEEKRLNIPCTIPEEDIYFVVDGLDGTRAFIRRQSHGIATMVALVRGGEVIGSCIGDVMSREIYYAPPYAHDEVYRISSDEHYEKLTPPTSELAQSYVLCRDRPENYGLTARKALGTLENEGRFKGLEVMGGSIGTTAARLWKGEVAALALRPSYETPWDLGPVLGILDRAGYIFLQADDRHGRFRFYNPKVEKDVYHRNHDVLIVHKKYRDEFLWKLV